MSLLKSKSRVVARWVAQWAVFLALAAGVVAVSPYIWRAVQWGWDFLPSADGWLTLFGLLSVASAVRGLGRRGQDGRRG